MKQTDLAIKVDGGRKTAAHIALPTIGWQTRLKKGWNTRANNLGERDLDNCTCTIIGTEVPSDWPGVCHAFSTSWSDWHDLTQLSCSNGSRGTAWGPFHGTDPRTVGEGQCVSSYPLFKKRRHGECHTHPSWGGPYCLKRCLDDYRYAIHGLDLAYLITHHHDSDSGLSWDQLTASDINFAIVRPLVFKYARLENMAVIYACLVVRSHFLGEAESQLAYSGVNFSRATLCEILAMKILGNFASNRIQLVAGQRVILFSPCLKLIIINTTLTSMYSVDNRLEPARRSSVQCCWRRHADPAPGTWRVWSPVRPRGRRLDYVVLMLP